MTQDEALELLKSGKNIFITGAAGTGKTYLLKQFIEYLKEKNKVYSVTASTGIAATHLNGVTVHSWSGIGIKNEISKHDIRNLKPRIKSNYVNTEVLIIDEISMLHGHQLDMIDTIAKQLLKNNEPFGGLQIVFCGDFCQLPPVTKNAEDPIFAYESEAWINSNLEVCYLDKQYRQEDEDMLTNILNTIREGKVDTQIKLKLKMHENTYHNTEVKQFIKLYTTNIDVDIINNKELEKIEGKTHTFKMIEYGNKYSIMSLKKQCLAKETLKLKKGAPVLFIQNDQERRFVNGTLGTVIGFNTGAVIVKTLEEKVIRVTPGEWKIEDSEGRTICSLQQMPLILAWAITVHKSQGMTLDCAEIDLRNAFCYNMGYVALSRVKNLAGLKLLGFNNKALEIDPKMLEQDKIFKGCL